MVDLVLSGGDRKRYTGYQVTCNCFSISDGELQDVGVGLYPSMSLLNHDCRPNCVMMFEGKTLKLRAIRVIRACEELTISYTDVLAPCPERHSHLQEQYHFLCQCKRCSTADRDREMLAGEKSAWMSLRDSIPHLQQLQSEQRILYRRITLPDTGLLDLATDACISLDDYERALEYGSRALQPYKSLRLAGPPLAVATATKSATLKLMGFSSMTSQAKPVMEEEFRRRRIIFVC
ncbi:Histone-lysine N-methyltransferase SMYD3 [Triplophysa tibetana]|uniref:[histone H3]-lysine(4) N-trimethyltransferase n=1 Tax=Triplophysa tibetana TaxID=1572043 RepID=A0A5A9NN81_9TELE|nr:Histone-lysine N-methyltransferase SMYD3 [Triplophysa tibetana]